MNRNNLLVALVCFALGAVTTVVLGSLGRPPNVPERPGPPDDTVGEDRDQDRAAEPGGSQTRPDTRDRLESLQGQVDELRAQVVQFERERRATEQAHERLRAPLQWLQGLSAERFAGLSAEELRAMRVLDLQLREIEDADLALLQPMESLRHLELRRTAIGDQGLAHLASLPSLARLGLRETQVTDAGMPHLRNLRGLEHLDLNQLPITDRGLGEIQGMRGLNFLRLNYTKITDAGLAHLAGLENLDRLDLWGTAISGNPPYLWDLPALRHLELGATGVSKQWVEAFIAAHPDCYVSSPFGR